jgi:xanthine dehydrogenase small subunit
MIQFILNDKPISTDVAPGLTLLDFVRYHRHLTGTKIGCREGDCGACTVLIGELSDDKIRYRSVTSCLMPVANAQGKHVVTIEGINSNELNPVQQAMSDEAATQCGFCTPGFVMSLTGFCLQDVHSDSVAAIDGNICRCTGYKSIERAGRRLEEFISDRNNKEPITFATEMGIVPAYFQSIKQMLISINTNTNGSDDVKSKYFVGGGTDLYVQRHEEMVHAGAKYLSNDPLKAIRIENDDCVIGSACTVTDLMESDVFRNIFPGFDEISKLVSSTPIRNMATIGGNFVNASPIGDFTVFFLAMNARIVLTDQKKSRTINLREFYKGYKSLDKSPEEYISEIRFTKPVDSFKFNFEKVSKRTNLDIASVNSAMAVTTIDGRQIISITAGGVGPIPMYLKNTSDYLSTNKISEPVIIEACAIAEKEISPITDVRGSAAYKTLLLQQLIKAHFIVLFQDQIEPLKLVADEEY